MVPTDTLTGRRRFLKLLAASPLLSAAALPSGLLDEIFPSRGNGNSFAQLVGTFQDPDQDTGVAVSSIQDALNVFDLAKVCEKNLRAEHFAHHPRDGEIIDVVLLAVLLAVLPLARRAA